MNAMLFESACGVSTWETDQNYFCVGSKTDLYLATVRNKSFKQPSHSGGLS